MSKAPVMRKSRGGKSTSTSEYATIDAAVGAGIGIVTLNRPDVHNAFNARRRSAWSVAEGRTGQTG